MACGSVSTQQDQQQQQQHAITRSVARQPHEPCAQYTLREGSGHQAVRFLQQEHERVLSGLHKQVASLQQRCDDLQFEAQLRHVTRRDDSEWEEQLQEMTSLLEQRDATIADLQQQLKRKRRESEELTQQTKWRELQLQQQIKAGEQKITTLKEECLKLRAKVKDLRVYSAALRKADTNPEYSPRPQSCTSTVPETKSDYANNSFSFASAENSYPNNWRENRFNNSFSRRRRTSGASIDKQPLSTSFNSSVDASYSPLLMRRGADSNLASSTSRPGSVVLPPINLSQSVGRPQFRQHMHRFSSAPPAQTQTRSTRRRGSEAAIQPRQFPE